MTEEEKELHVAMNLAYINLENAQEAYRQARQKLAQYRQKNPEKE